MPETLGDAGLPRPNREQRRRALKTWKGNERNGCQTPVVWTGVGRDIAICEGSENRSVIIMEENQAEPSATQGDEQDAVATDPVVENWLEVGSRADKLAEFCDKTFDDDFLTTLDALFYLACANLKGIGISADELHEAVDAVFAANIPEVHALLPKLNGTGK